jgi:hypothetical protein
MHILRLALAIAVILAPLTAIRDALAQVPPHPPGSICVTPRFWCWHQPPGPAGTQCTCPSPYGPVAGILD